MFIRPLSSYHYHQRLRRLNSLPAARIHLERGPPPLLRDVGPNTNALASPERTSAAPSRGMWAGVSCSTEELGREKYQGDPGIGRPV
jgi:hypothetical protein